AAGFDVTAGGRPPHFGFGGGIHYCLGHYVARTDMCEALTVLARRLREPRPAAQAAWLPDSGNTGPVRLPIAFVPGQSPGASSRPARPRRPRSARRTRPPNRP